MNLVIIHCDGLCEPNPGGVATYGWIARDEDTGKVLKSKSTPIVYAETQTTNNLAEYAALQNVLMWLSRKALYFLTHGKQVVIRTDSQLVVNQVRGNWKCNSPTLAVRLAIVRGMLDALQKAGVTVQLEWVPREQNAEADELSRQAYFESTGKCPPERAPRRSRLLTSTSS